MTQHYKPLVFIELGNILRTCLSNTLLISIDISYYYIYTYIITILFLGLPHYRVYIDDNNNKTQTERINMYYPQIEERNRLTDSHVTLNGKPARVIGRFNEVPTVAQIPIGLSVDFCWKTVQNIVDNKNGCFKS